MTPFVKLEALGNDFVLLDGRTAPLDVGAGEARALSDRRHGIGFDQVLVLARSSASHAFDVTIRNADGSAAEQCGNGMRALAAWLDQHGELPDEGLTIGTPAGPVLLSRAAPIDGEPAWCAELPGLVLGTGDPNQRDIRLGNPHRVVRIDASPDRDRLAAEYARHPDAASLNLGLVQAVDRRTLRLQVHERGAGPTPACGSGACAAAAAMIDGGVVEGPVRVEQPGGTVVVDWIPGESRVRLTGPARVVFEGQIAWPTLRTTPSTTAAPNTKTSSRRRPD